MVKMSDDRSLQSAYMYLENKGKKLKSIRILHLTKTVRSQDFSGTASELVGIPGHTLTFPNYNQTFPEAFQSVDLIVLFLRAPFSSTILGGDIHDLCFLKDGHVTIILFSPVSN